MKKKLLFLFALAATTLAGSAKDALIDLTGEGDLYGMTRQFNARGATAGIDWSSSLNFSAEGVSVDIQNVNASLTTGGFALMKATDTGAKYKYYNGIEWNGGYSAASQVDPQITMSVPNGTISEVVLKVAGDNMYTATGTRWLLAFNGTDVTPTQAPEWTSTANVVLYTYTPDEPVDEVVITLGTDANKFYNRYVNSIEVSYATAGATLESPNLSFSDASATGFVGQEVQTPELVNPYDVPLTWSSTNEKVATVDAEGKVTLVSKGTANIVASFEGNDKYEDQAVRYTINVWGTADNAAQVDGLVPQINDQAYINFPITVTFVNGISVYGVDPEGNAIHFTDTAEVENGDILYVVGNVIPAGWVIYNTNAREVVLAGLSPAAPEETVEVVYPVVESIDYQADKGRVVALKNVEFRKLFMNGDYIMDGYVDGITYSFRNQFNIEVPEGLYDMVVIVNYSTLVSSGRNLSPIKISYVPESYEVTFSAEGLTAEEVNSVDEGRTITITGATKEDTYTVTLGIPVGFDGYLCMNMNDYQGGEHQEFKVRKAGEESVWANKAEMLAYPGIKETDSTTFNVDADDQYAQFYLVKGDQVLNVPVTVTSNVTKDLGTSVEGIEAAAEASYYTVDGIKTAVPTAGIYIKVVNGKASKVIVK